MTTMLNACGSGGWTLVMKMNGSKVNIFINKITTYIDFGREKEIEKLPNRFLKFYLSGPSSVVLHQSRHCRKLL